MFNYFTVTVLRSAQLLRTDRLLRTLPRYLAVYMEWRQPHLDWLGTRIRRRCSAVATAAAGWWASSRLSPAPLNRLHCSNRRSASLMRPDVTAPPLRPPPTPPPSEPRRTRSSAGWSHIHFFTLRTKHDAWGEKTEDSLLWWVAE